MNSDTTETEDRPTYIKQPAIYYRNPKIVGKAMAIVEASDDPVPSEFLLGLLGAEFDTSDAQTLLKIVSELVAHGAIHKTGKYLPGRDTRSYRITPLGRAWMDQEILPLVGQKQQINYDQSTVRATPECIAALDDLIENADEEPTRTKIYAALDQFDKEAVCDAIRVLKAGGRIVEYRPRGNKGLNRIRIAADGD